MKKRFKLLALAFLMGGFTACNDLDIAPINIVQDPVVFTDDGMQAYMAALYSRIPMEDFRYSGSENDGFNTWNQIWLPSLNTGENANRNQNGYFNPARGYWDNAYVVIRNANYLIQHLPEYVSTMGQDKIDRWIGEAKFIRAYTYFALARRYGGVPITDQVLQYLDGDVEPLQIARSSEEATYDFILKDLDEAMVAMPEASEKPGRANKYIIEAFKSRVALNAGSKARYGIPYTVEGVMLTGIPKARANDYFTQAFKAAKNIEGKYSLYKKNWSATDKQATADNYAALFLDNSSSETIFYKDYFYPNSVHSFDAVFSPPHMTTTYGDRFNPTLDYVELFDGLPKNERGELKTLNDDGTYIVYDYVEQLFEECEPRLRGTVLLPGMPFKKARTDIRRGTLVESVDPAVPIQKFIGEGLTAPYTSNPFYAANVKQSGTWNQQTPITLSTGEKINPTGMDGPTSSNNATVTGFHGRKYLNPNLEISATELHRSSQRWIDLRYAEVVLNRAEAALELAQNGVSSVDGVSLQADAFNCINQIRERAGAVLLTSDAELSTGAPLAPGTGVGSYVLAPTRGLQIIRIERRKELAFENKLWWDILRWRTADVEVNQRTWRKLNPFLFAKGAKPELTDYVRGKYIFDCRFDERNGRVSIPTKAYYEAIPGDEIASNPNMEQNDEY
ncbi:RagB/SusD family nutrient uptake outer membrane protein [Sphingobacterium lactis]|uniref:RagB/SusD family nutrient uptake outer membrane protein n=1 Tax=Sphingobacterium lactis TaxID=797291 RepID=UPI003DA3CF7A